MNCSVEMASGVMICMQSSMKIGTSVQAILIFDRRILRGCTAGTEGIVNYAIEMRSCALIYIHIMFHEVCFSHSKVNKGRYTYRHRETHTDSRVIP
jgi:hypothetical protein